MRAARVLKFEPADRVGATAGGFDLLVRGLIAMELVCRLLHMDLFSKDRLCLILSEDGV